LKRNAKPPGYQAAFTLLELIIVLIILSILTSYILSRPSTADTYQQDNAIEQLISAAQLTQQLSMNDPSRVFSLNIQTNQINLLADGNPFSSAEVDFPLTVDSGVTLSPPSSITFDTIGMTTGATINVTADNIVPVCFESSGYIHRC